MAFFRKRLNSVPTAWSRPGGGDDASAYIQMLAARIPSEVQELLNVLLTSSYGPSSPLGRLAMPSGPGYVSKLAQYVAPDSLICSLVYMGRYLGHISHEDRLALLQPYPLTLLFSTAVVLADKFVNDSCYDDVLPAISLLTGTRPSTMRKKEVELLGFLLNNSSMFVEEREFENVVYLLDERPWRRLRQEGSLALLLQATSTSASAADLVTQLFTTASGRPPRTGGLFAPLRTLSSFIRSSRARSRARPDGPEQAKGGGDDSASQRSFVRRRWTFNAGDEKRGFKGENGLVHSASQPVRPSHLIQEGGKYAGPDTPDAALAGRSMSMPASPGKDPLSLGRLRQKPTIEVHAIPFKDDGGPAQDGAQAASFVRDEADVIGSGARDDQSLPEIREESSLELSRWGRHRKQPARPPVLTNGKVTAPPAGPTSAAARLEGPRGWPRSKVGAGRRSS